MRLLSVSPRGEDGETPSVPLFRGKDGETPSVPLFRGKDGETPSRSPRGEKDDVRCMMRVVSL